MCTIYIYISVLTARHDDDDIYIYEWYEKGIQKHVPTARNIHLLFHEQVVCE